MTDAIARNLQRSLLALVATLPFVAIPSIAQAVAPARPAFAITSTVAPTHIVAGDESGFTVYSVVVTNVGGAPTDGSPIILADELPEGFTFNPFPESPLGGVTFVEDQQTNSPGPCEPEPTIVTCEASLAPLQPGETLSMTVATNVPAQAAGVAVNHVSVRGGGASEVSARESAPVDASQAPFGFQVSETTFNGPEGGAFTQAGGHPYRFHLRFQTNTFRQSFFGDPVSGDFQSVRTTLPKGLVINPTATPVRCTAQELERPGAGSACPDASAVGVVHVSINAANSPVPAFSEPVYNVVPPPGYPAELAFNVAGYGVFVHLLGGLNSEGDYELTAVGRDLTSYTFPSGVSLELWGDPSEESHDFKRGLCALPTVNRQQCPVERLGRSFLTMPSACSAEPMTTLLSMNSYQEPGSFVTASPSTVDGEGDPVGVEGCDALEFTPTISSQSTTNQGDAPSGLDFTIHQPQNDAYEGLSTANLKNVRVTLPEGMVLNPSAASGLGSCTEEQVGYQPREGKIRFTSGPQSCPDAAKLGTLEVDTPLLEEKLPGAIYLATPYANPFGNLTTIYLAIESPKTGIFVKLAGKVEPDPVTGRLTAVFTENPELPIEDIETHFFEGPRAALTSPLACGTKTTTTTLTPWSTPQGADAHPTDSFQTSSGCSSSEATAPKNVDFTAGTASPLSGAYSPFVLRIARPDGSQRITGVETTLPAGLVGKLAGIPYCPESGIAQAISREQPEQGKLEQASPSCPASSEVGTVNVTAGAGSSPIPVSGHAYLAGPYKGAPLSMVVIVPAVAGPFDLGTVVDRIALNVGEYDARIHAVADPLPTIRDGIPLDVRSIEVKLDRPGFTLNPTSCEVMAIEGQVTTQAGQNAPLNNRFQVGECERLGFKPKISLSLKGGTKRTGHPALKAVVTYPKQGAYANIARAQVSLPHSEFLDQGNIGKSCTKPVLAARQCPAKSIYGKVRAWTPLLEKPLEGPVYLVGGYGYKLPALVAELNGQIRVLLVGKVDTAKNHGIRNTFEAVPDAPVERFVLEMKGGKKYGLLENSEDLCKKKQVAGASFRAQNGKVLQLSPKIANSCGSKGKTGKGKRAKGK